MEKTNQNLQSGFTIIEIMVVVVIIGILMAALIPAYQGYQRRARRSATTVHMKRIQAAIDGYFEDVGEYPQTLENLSKEPTDERKERWHGPYFETKDKRAPKDAFGIPYKYTVTPDAENPYELIAYGGSKGKNEPRREWLDVWKL